jgi:ATP-binding cassette subfamily F protein uup
LRSMNFLSVDRISKNLGERILFQDLSFGLSKGDKVALIANNGTGKTSLLNILTGQDTPDNGNLAIREGVSIGYLKQQPDFDPELSIHQLIKGANSEVLTAIREYELALHQFSDHHSEENERVLNDANKVMDEMQAWDYERRLTQILGKFNIYDLEQRVGSMSGGQKKRLALALVLLDEPDLLILDEPTNHLDIEMIEWLEKYLSQQNVTLLMVTHDRYFLDNVSNQILEMHNGKLYHHKGSYAYFLEKKAEREEVFRTETGRAVQLMKKELEWMRRQPKARTTKSKSRIEAFYEIEEKAKGGPKEAELRLEVKMNRIGGKVLEIKKLSKSYGDKVMLKGFDYTFKKGERIGIVGKNGAGKTTFLNLITGLEQPDGGKINTGDTIVMGYYSQEGMNLKQDKRVIDILTDIAEVIELGDGRKLTASQFLQYFMFPPAMQYTPVHKLSGGEQRRLYLLTVLIKNPNFLILDEPTNDLDLLTLNKLEEFLSGFSGCLILVTHDRYFMDMLVDHIFVFEGEGNIRDYNGSYTDYRVEAEEREKLAKETADLLKESLLSKPKSEEKRKMSFKERFEYEQLQKELEVLGNEKKSLETELNSGDLSFEELSKKADRLGEINEALDEKEMRWLELDELND